ncbi:MAG: hypothetical protein A2Y64_08435 [Candidatus Coatesbacteria bacterium RBG_13_66_14]|uniref:DUF86 domain-containing protein n=1 Tax=Candidatus Coatesbacteria bacterium RBG_13_66_14 TaxID=1817816 RepID=A0A1F5FHY2_9BACT|nr:MAG: hypothetical protein A2Y64_08435 [Candidatus Coatesbacteria bacterium RBG_13_66_14]
MYVDDPAYIEDILIAARNADKFVKGCEYEDFEADSMCQAAVIRQLELIGEAVKCLTEAFRDRHPEVPWKRMAGMRDVLIHGYRRVNVSDVWKTVKELIPGLIDKAEAILSEED